MNHVEQITTRPKEESSKSIFAALNIKALFELNKLSQVSEQDGEYSPTNPKINIYKKDSKDYVHSTNWHSTVKSAIASAEKKFPEHKGNFTGSIVK